MNGTPCDKKACIVSFLAVYIFMMAYSMVVHGILLKADYEAYASLWRPMEDMQTKGPICWILHAVMAAVLVCLFKKFKKGLVSCSPEAAKSCCPIKSGGVCFGLKIGLLLGAYHASFYVLLPISEALAFKWFLAEFFMGIGIGAVLGMVSKSKSCDITPSA